MKQVYPTEFYLKLTPSTLKLICRIRNNRHLFKCSGVGYFVRPRTFLSPLNVRTSTNQLTQFF